MKYTLNIQEIMEFGQRTDSQGNPHQEDCCYPLPGNVDAQTDRLFILCDGMGGHDAGEVASATVCEAMSAAIKADGLTPDDVLTDAMLQQAISAAYDALDSKDTGAVKKMGTTMTFLMFHAAGATVAHIGDSRVYHFRPGATGADTRLMSVTRDHSLVNDLLAAGELTEEEARNFPRKNVITRAMQPNMERRCVATIAHVTDIQPGDFFYMCSDGMLEQTSDEELCNVFSEAGGDIEQKKATLIEQTINNKDNHTAVIVEVTDTEGVPAPWPAAEVRAEVAPMPPVAPAPAMAEMAMPSAAPADMATQPIPNTTAPQNADGWHMPFPQMPKVKSNNGKYIVIGAVAFVVLAIAAAVFFFVLRPKFLDRQDSEPIADTTTVSEGLFEEDDSAEPTPSAEGSAIEPVAAPNNANAQQPVEEPLQGVGSNERPTMPPGSSIEVGYDEWQQGGNNGAINALFPVSGKK